MKYILFAVFLTINFSTLAQECFDSTEICFFYLSTQPEFPGGMDSLHAFIDKNFQWNQEQKTVEGRVFVQFNVNEDGSVSHVKVIKGLCEACDAEAIRVIKISPKWKPAIIDSVPQRTRVVLPIKFSL